MSIESAREFLARYVSDEEFQRGVDSAEEGSGYAREQGFDFRPDELDQASGASLDTASLAARALYGVWP